MTDVFEVGDLDAGNAPWTECTEFREWALDQIAELKPDLVAVSAAYNDVDVRATGNAGGHQNVPTQAVVIEKAECV